MEYFLQIFNMQRTKITGKDYYFKVKIMEFIAKNYLILSLFLIFMLFFI